MNDDEIKKIPIRSDEDFRISSLTHNDGYELKCQYPEFYTARIERALKKLKNVSRDDCGEER